MDTIHGGYVAMVLSHTLDVMHTVCSRRVLNKEED